MRPVFAQNRWLPWAAAALTGVLLGLAQPKVDFWPLALFAWAPLAIVSVGRSPRQVFQLAYAAHAVAFFIILYWIEVVVRVFGSVPIVISWIPWVLLVAYVAAWPAWGFWAARKIEQATGGRFSMLWMLPVLLVSAEWIRGQLFTGFPWGHAAYALHGQPVLIQVSDLVGVHGILFVLALLSSAIAALFVARGRTRVLLPIVAGLLAVAVVAYGTWRIEDVRARAKQADEHLKVGLIQGNIDQKSKWDASFRRETLSIYKRESELAAEKGARLLIWPETAAPFYFEPEYDHPLSKEIVELAKDVNGYVLFGAPASGVRGGKLRSFNRAYLLGPSGETIDTYDKTHLVPFSEYVPLPLLFGWIEKLVPVVGNFAGGDQLRALAIPGARFGTLICFESVFPEETRQFVVDGARFLTVITNDAWFLRTSATYQHISMAVFRAIEARVPVLQAGNTGVTAVIGPDGVTQDRLPIFEQGHLVADIGLADIPSVYVVYGDWFAYLMLLGAVILTGFALRVRSAERRTLSARKLEAADEGERAWN